MIRIETKPNKLTKYYDKYAIKCNEMKWKIYRIESTLPPCANMAKLESTLLAIGKLA